ncbi:Uncharacterised protein [Vibrio cholerae]|nr:Uncharacterised protein [Vibrio cholerae]
MVRQSSACSDGHLAPRLDRVFHAEHASTLGKKPTGKHDVAP